MFDKFQSRIPRPKITFDRFGQVFFTIKEVVKLVANVNLGLLVTVLVLNASWGFLAVPGFYLEKLILDRIVQNIGNPNWQAAIQGILILLGARFLLDLTRNLLGSMNGFLRRSLSRVFSARLEVLMGQKIAELDLITTDTPEFKEKFNKIQREASEKAWGIMWPLSDIPNYLVGFISAVFVLFFLSPLVTFGVIVFSLPQFFINSKYIKKNYELDTILSSKYLVWGWLSYYLVRNKNIMELKLLELSGYLGEKLTGIQEEINNKWIDFGKKREMSNFAGYFPLSLFEFAISFWLVSLVIVKKITVGSFEMYLRSLRSAQSNLVGLVSSILEIYENYIYVADLIWFLNLKPQISLNSGGKKIEDLKDFSIEFEDVWFKYRDTADWVSRGVNFKINEGERIALVGINGAGKSTLIKLLARLYEPTKGRILVGGVDLKEIDLSDWREKLAILFQEFEGYPFTVHEAIGYGDVKRIDNLDEIKEAVKKTGMEGFINSLPLRYENPLDVEFDQGIRPSIGQWQRIGISRMLFRNKSRVLVMDEPTSNVDPEAEEKIFLELTNITKNKILIFVTQRFSTVRLADRILVVDKGKIVESGSHKELIKKNKGYAKLFKLQAKGYQ